jgi:hypothetical protein
MNAKKLLPQQEVDFFNYHAVGILEVALMDNPAVPHFQTKVDTVENYLRKICTLYAKDTLCSFSHY